MIVSVEIRLLHELLRRLRRLREFLKLARCVEVVVPILALVVLPPLRGVPAMQAHVVEARDVWQIVLPDGEAELRLVDLHPGGAEAVQQREGFPDRVAPAAMPQLHGHRILGKRAKQLREVLARFRCVLEARRELCEQRAQLAGRSERFDARAEVVDVRLGDLREEVEQGTLGARRPLQRGLAKHLRVREFLIELQREVEAGRRAFGPPSRHLVARLAVEGGIHLDRIEVLGVETQLVELVGSGALRTGLRIEQAVPGSLAGRVIPARRADAHLAHAASYNQGSGIRDQGSRAFDPRSPRSMLTINEIFYSVHGESSYAGRPCVFVRLTACDLRCSWCDTPYAFHEGTKRPLDEVLEELDAYTCPLVEVTGGEPLLQEDVYPLMEQLLERGRTVLLETGGHRSTARVPDRVVTILDVKCPGSGESAKNDWSNLDRLRPQDEVKFVVKDRADYEYARDVIARHGLAARAAAIHLSPVHGVMNPRTLSEWVLADNLPVRVQLQLHKYIWDPATRGV